MPCISRGFTGHSLPDKGKLSKVTELGSILLNSVANYLKDGALPELFKFMLGDFRLLVNGLTG